MEGDRTVVARASAVSYTLLWLIVGGIAVLYGVLAVRGVDGALFVVAALLVVAVVGTVALWRLRLVIARSGIAYQGVFRRLNIPVSSLVAMRGALIGRESSTLGLVRGPGFYLIFDILSVGESRQIYVNMKPFDKSGLCRFLARAKADNLPLCLDQPVATMLGL